MKTLVINASMEPVALVDWQKAISLIACQKAEPISHYDRLIRSVSLSLRLPKILRLKRWVNLSRRRPATYGRQQVFIRDGWSCQYCSIHLSSKSATIDHVLPLAQGGTTTFLNAVAACGTCNHKKGNRTPEQASMPLFKRPINPYRSDGVSSWLWALYEDWMDEVGFSADSP